MSEIEFSINVVLNHSYDDLLYTYLHTFTYTYLYTYTLYQSQQWQGAIK